MAGLAVEQGERLRPDFGRHLGRTAIEIVNGDAVASSARPGGLLGLPPRTRALRAALGK